MAEVPAGIVTFVFTDVEGSTRLWAADAESTAASLERHDEIIRSCFAARGGYVFGWAGDHFRAAFVDPKAAVGAAMAAQTALATEDWNGPALRVRMGLHRGRATQRDGDYFGTVPNTAARLEALAAGGQIVMSDVVASAVDVETLSLGRHRLRDVPEPIEVLQVGLGTFRPIEVINPSLSSLPLPGTPIIGRQEEVGRARQLLETAPMVTLTGTGGCGKTRLAVEIAYQELPSRADGCYFVDLSSVSDGSELPAAIAQAIRLEFGGSIDGALDQVVEHLAGRDALLVLDNCEHILDDCAMFAERLLSRGSATALLATTRQRLEVPGEQVIAVGSLGLGGESAAVELFLERAVAANPGFVCGDHSDPTRSTVVEICQQLDGMPLPIELAAARVSVLTPGEILDRMADRFRLLSGGRGRQKRRTLQATLDWSYDLLDPDEQRFFRRCGVFVGSFDLPAAVAVSGFDDYGAMDLLESLVEKSLLSIDEGQENLTTRYRLLETIRIYAGDLLARSEDVLAAREAHLEWFTSLVGTAEFTEANSLPRALRLRHDWSNVSSALEWAIARGDDPETGEPGHVLAARLAFGCQGLWETHISAIEGRRWVEEITAGLPAGELRDWMIYIRAVLAMQLDDFPLVHSLLEGLAADDATAAPIRAHAAGLLAFLSCRQHPERALELVHQAAGICDAHNLGGEARTPHVWAGACLALYENRIDEALPAFVRAHDHLDRDLDITNHFVMSGLALAAAQLLSGDPANALATVERWDWSGSVWDSSPIVRALALIDLDRASEAADLVVSFGYEALHGRLSRMANDALVGLAALALNRGELDHAWELLRKAAVPRTPFTIGLAEGLGDRMGHGDTLRAIHRGREKPLIEMDASASLRLELERIRSSR